MAYDETLARRVRPLMARRRGFSEKKMFGGVGYLLHGNMCVGLWKDSLVVRVGPDAYAESLAELHAMEFDVTGRPMKGWVLVGPEGLVGVPSIKAWVERACEFVATLPPKA